MPRHEATPLREAPNAAPPGARVIDADFDIVGEGARAPRAKPRKRTRDRPKRTLLGQVRHALAVAGLVVLIGFLIPPAFVLLSVLLRNG